MMSLLILALLFTGVLCLVLDQIIISIRRARKKCFRGGCVWVEICDHGEDCNIDGCVDYKDYIICEHCARPLLINDRKVRYAKRGV